MKYFFAWFFIAASLPALAQPQKDLCDGIAARSQAKIVDSILNGASLSQPCGNSLPLHVALNRFPDMVPRFLEAGVDADAIGSDGTTVISLATNQDKIDVMAALIRQRFSTAPRFDERESEADEGFVLLGNHPRSALPLYLIEEQKHQAGWILWGERIFELAEGGVQGEGAVLAGRAAGMLKLWGQIPRLDWRALDQMTDAKSVKTNLALLIRKKNFIVDFAYVLQEINVLDEKKENAKALLQATKDQAAIGRYIAYVQEQIFKLESPKVHAALDTIARILGVKVLPEIYKDAVHWLARRDPDFGVLFATLATSAVHTNQDLDEARLQAAQLALNSAAQQGIARVASLGEAGFQSYQKATIVLLKAVQMTASLMNTQFATDSFLALVHDASSNNPRLERANLNEASLNALANFDASEIDPRLTTDELRTIYELGPVGISALREQLAEARKRAPKWTSPQEGLGTLFHGGWANVTVPNKSERSILKATRTIGMARGLNVVFEQVELDFSKLGAISRKKARALLSFVQELLDNQREDADAVYARSLGENFNAQERELLLATSTTFVANLNNALFAIHSRLRELKPKV